MRVYCGLVAGQKVAIGSQELRSQLLEGSTAKAPRKGADADSHAFAELPVKQARLGRCAAWRPTSISLSISSTMPRSDASSASASSRS